ncbi:hypothetical protein FA95DRAFT_1496441 [Auriscalpium vulgare]|uniref:Uncharacterized protein n=1 Tax=Auriscalpium vulgare TaxID=40419 RepID=A0ACB8RL25_9AGAM|nr:hypothetical protein FA95DRAFT_1496441 [Auriscalpium vulgare]
MATDPVFPKKKSDKNRSGTPALHIGAWGINGNFLKITRDSYVQKPETLEAMDAFLGAFKKYVAPRIRQTLNQHNPEQARTVERCAEHVRRLVNFREALDFNGACLCIAIKQGSSELIHVDFNDHERFLTCVLPVGDAVGAHVFLPQLNQRFAVERGSMFAFKAKRLAHCTSPPTSGERIVLTCFTDYATAKRVENLRKREETNRLLRRSVRSGPKRRQSYRV